MDLVLQLLATGLVVGSLYAPCALGWGLIYGTTPHLHVAHGAVFAVAEDLAYPEQKLLSMARIFATDAEILLLDEPTSGLDTDSLQKIVPMVRRLVEHGKTVLLIEHNMELISQLSDEVVFLHQGRVMARGRAEQITRDPALTEIYFGA